MQTAQINLLLSQVKTCIRDRNYTIVNREKNRNSLMKYPFSMIDFTENMFLELKSGDYMSGPEQDHDKTEPDPLYIFLKNVNCIDDSYNIDFYLKFKIKTSENCKLVIISIHENEVLR